MVNKEGKVCGKVKRAVSLLLLAVFIVVSATGIAIKLGIGGSRLPALHTVSGIIMILLTVAHVILETVKKGNKCL